jgi:hypothetical protein
MSRVRWAVSTEGAIAVGASATKTFLQIIAPANQRLVVRRICFSFNGVSATQEPCQICVVKQTTAGTPGSAATPVREGGGSETIQTTAGKNYSAEPTNTDFYRRRFVHPQAGIETKFAWNDDIEIPGGGRLGFVIISPAGANYNTLIDVSGEE